MANQRSPNCPQITFEEAAQKARLVYQKEHTHPAPKEAVAADLGYTSLNGRSLSIIAALRQYGLIELTGEGLSITEDAVSYFVLDSGEEWQNALLRLVYHPPFFQSLRDQFGTSLPSESTLKHYLIKLGFLPKAAEDVIQVYRENQKLVQDIPKRYTVEDTSRDELMLTPLHSAPVPLALPPSASTKAEMSFSFALSPDAKAELHLRGSVGTDELELLRDHIELTIRALARSQKANPTAPKESTEAPRRLPAPADDSRPSDEDRMEEAFG